MPSTDPYQDVSDAYDLLVRRSGRTGPGAPASADEAHLRAAINHWPDLTDDARESAVAVAGRVLGRVVRVEVGAGDAEFAPTEVAEILALLRAAQRRFEEAHGVVARSGEPPSERLSKLLLDGVQAIPVPDGCTGYWDDFALLEHDGDTCPVHELGVEA